MKAFDFTKPHKVVNGLPVLLSADEAAAEQSRIESWQAEETSRLKVEVMGAIKEIETAAGPPRPLRDIVLKDSNHGAYQKAVATEGQITALRARLT